MGSSHVCGSFRSEVPEAVTPWTADLIVRPSTIIREALETNQAHRVKCSQTVEKSRAFFIRSPSTHSGRTRDEWRYGDDGEEHQQRHRVRPRDCRPGVRDRVGVAP